MDEMSDVNKKAKANIFGFSDKDKILLKRGMICRIESFDSLECRSGGSALDRVCGRACL